LRDRQWYFEVSELEQLEVSNLVQELLPFSKIETTSFGPTVAQELPAVSNLAQEIVVVSKIETTSFEPTVATANYSRTFTMNFHIQFCAF
jgi:hypothetical protein